MGSGASTTNKSEDTTAAEDQQRLEEALNAGPEALQQLFSKAGDQQNARDAIITAIELRDRAQIEAAIAAGEAAGLPEGELARVREALNDEEFLADTADAPAGENTSKLGRLGGLGKKLVGAAAEKAGAAVEKAQQIKTGAATYYVQHGGSPKKPSWSPALYLMMCDIRRWAQVTPRDMLCLRKLADAAGAVGQPLIYGVKGETIEDFNGVKCKRMWPEGLDTPAKRYIMYIHGGAYCMGSPMTHAQIASILAKKANAAVLLPDYRLCPENTVTEAIEDCMKVYEKLLSDLASESKEDIKSAARRVVVGGESAGAALSLGLALKLREKNLAALSGSDELPQPGGLLLMSPWANLLDAMEQTYPSWKENEAFDSVTPELAKLFAQHVLSAQKFGGMKSEAAKQEMAGLSWKKLIQDEKIQADLIEIAKSPEVSPALAPSFESLPATLVAIGGGETLRDSQRELVKSMRESKVDVTSQEFEDMPHAVGLLNFVEDSRMKHADKSNEMIQNCSPMDVALQSVDFINKCMPDPNALAGFDTCKWMFTNAGLKSTGLTGIIAKRDPMRWSGSLSIPDAIADLQKHKEDRPVTVKTMSGNIDKEYHFDSIKETIEFLSSYA